MAYEFHYTPTGSGAISGQQVLQQTEEAINELGDYVNDNVGGAIDVAQQALETAQNAKQDAQTALNTANNAEGVAIQAQNDVSNLSGTVTNIGNRVTTAEGNIGNLQGRMTTAEGNIGNLQGRMTTAEGNIGNLQTAVSTAQATANSAQQTATTARQQSYVFRYSSTALVASSTNSNSLLDNTDNLKVGDKVIDSDGVLFSITAIDTANSTFTVGSALVDLALDANVMHLSGNETAAGQKTFSDMSSFQGSYLGNEASANARSDLILESNRDTHGQSGIFLTKFRQNKAQGSMSGNDVAYLSFDCLENSVRTNNGLRINFLNFVDDIPQRFILWSGISEKLLGVASAPWSDVQTYKVNNLEPSSLSLPDLSNGIDISSYITAPNAVSTYTPVVNGWVSIVLKSTSGALACFATQGDFANGHYSATSLVNETEPCVMLSMPVIGGIAVNIYTKGANAYLYSAKFFPCQGNV